MTDATLTLRAYSPGKFPILVVQMPDDELRLLYYETDYDLEAYKPAEEDWLRDNAIGRHSFIKVETLKELDASRIQDYVESEILNS